MKIDILFPVLNEENRLRAGIEQTLSFLKDAPFEDYRLTIVDNGSVDQTEVIAQELVAKHPAVRYLKLAEKGVGVAFRAGVAATDFDLVGYMDIDLSTDIASLNDVYSLFTQQPDVEVVTGSRNLPASQVIDRPFFRELTSKYLAKIINVSLGTQLHDYMCGFKFFRREALKGLMEKASDEKGWFYCAELLIYGEWAGVKIHELPVKWVDEREHSKVDNQLFQLIHKYLKQIKRMRGRRPR